MNTDKASKGIKRFEGYKPMDFETISDTNKSEYIKGFKEGVFCSTVGYIIVAIIALVSTLHC